MAPSTISRFFRHDFTQKPFLFTVRSNSLFIISAVAIGLFTDLFLYGLVVPILPYLLQDKIGIPQSQVQTTTSALLAAYAAASVVMSPVAGAIADRTSSRQLPFLGGLSALLVATILLFTGRSLPVLVFARVFQGASSAFVWTVGLALALDTVGGENMGKTIGSIFSFISVGELAAPILGGVIYNKAGEYAVLGLCIGILVIDLLMRLFVIEKKVAKRYRQQCGDLDDEEPESSSNSNNQDNNNENNDAEANEESPLLNKDKEDSDEYHIPEEYYNSKIYRNVPILYCLRHSSLILAFIVALVQAMLVSSFDGTIPTHALELYGFDSLKSGLLFIPIGLMNLAIGPIAGWAVDKYGVKPLATIGYAYLVPVLILVRLPGSDKAGLIGYAIILAFTGIGLATISAPSIVEAGAIIDHYFERNPDFFGGNPPYAQLYSINSMVFSAGLAVGPLVAGLATETLGYGNMSAILAVISGVTAIACYVWLGGRPKLLRKKRV